MGRRYTTRFDNDTLNTITRDLGHDWTFDKSYGISDCSICVSSGGIRVYSGRGRNWLGGVGPNFGKTSLAV